MTEDQVTLISCGSVCAALVPPAFLTTHEPSSMSRELVEDVVMCLTQIGRPPQQLSHVLVGWSSVLSPGWRSGASNDVA